MYMSLDGTCPNSCESAAMMKLAARHRHAPSLQVAAKRTSRARHPRGASRLRASAGADAALTDQEVQRVTQQWVRGTAPVGWSLTRSLTHACAAARVRHGGWQRDAQRALSPNALLFPAARRVHRGHEHLSVRRGGHAPNQPSGTSRTAAPTAEHYRTNPKTCGLFADGVVPPHAVWR